MCKEVTLCSLGSAAHHAPFVFRQHEFVPDVTTDGWLDPLNSATERLGIDCIFPAHDDVVIALAEHRDSVAAEVISSPVATCLITRSKSKTYNLLRGKLPVPSVFSEAPSPDEFPVFVKPDRGQGSQGAQRVSDPEMLRALLKSRSNQIVMEDLTGRECTVDCLSDRRRGLMFCGGRERIRTRAGIAMNSAPVDEEMNRQFREYAEIISRDLELHGAWFFQTRENAKGEPVLLEIAPRVGGTMALHRVLGVNFPMLSLLEHQGVPFEIMTNTCDIEIDRALVNRYRSDIEYSHIYVDLDDTLLVNGAVNTVLVSLLFQSVERGCKLSLLTRTLSDAEEVLREKRLSGLFDDVIQIGQSDSKADHIDPDGAIFIDDSFSERQSVVARHAIPTFDCSMIEMLLDVRA